MFRRFPLNPGLALAPLALLAWGTGTASAHEVPDLDLRPLEDHVGLRIDETVDGDRKIHAAWVRLGKTLRKASPKGLPDDLRKVAAARAAATTKFPADLVLADLVDDLVHEAEEILEGRPEDLEEDIDRVEPKRRKGPEATAVKARLKFLEGRAAGAGGDGRKRLALWTRAAAGFATAASKASKAVDRQGGPFPETVVAVPGSIHTVAGTGTGGFNGHGRTARRSQLYWVEEVKFAPDGRLVILDWNNHMVRRLEADGTLSRICGSGPTAASTSSPAWSTWSGGSCPTGPWPRSRGAASRATKGTAWPPPPRSSTSPPTSRSRRTAPSSSRTCSTTASGGSRRTGRSPRSPGRRE